MAKLTKVINTTKKLINLPYNKCNLENYSKIFHKYFGSLDFIRNPNLPCQLMSGTNPHAGIVKTPNKGNIYIIGKGILFDSGGLDIKLRGMSDMTGDKAGAIIALSVANYLKGNVVAVCPITTNLLQSSQITPGDEIKIGKKIVKVMNTDAEGRLILAEAISTLNVSRDDIIITVATLTGSVGYAIGDRATGIFTKSSKLARLFSEAAFEAKEEAWLLPMWDYLEEDYYKRKIIVNSNDKIKCGAVEAALFLKQFVPNPENFIHLDIAYSAFDENKRATGVPIKSLINFVKKIK